MSAPLGSKRQKTLTAHRPTAVSCPEWVFYAISSNVHCNLRLGVVSYPVVQMRAQKLRKLGILFQNHGWKVRTQDLHPCPGDFRVSAFLVVCTEPGPSSQCSPRLIMDLLSVSNSTLGEVMYTPFCISMPELPKSLNIGTSLVIRSRLHPFQCRRLQVRSLAVN